MSEYMRRKQEKMQKKIEETLQDLHIIEKNAERAGFNRKS